MIELVGTGQRTYHCQATMCLTNETDVPIAELAAFFHSFEDGVERGRSKGNSFPDVPPGASAEAVFETPNAPCDADLNDRPTVGACRRDASFTDKAICVERIVVGGPILPPRS